MTNPLKYSFKKVIIIFFAFYSVFFIIGAFAAPLLAHFKMFYQADYIYALFHKSCHQDAVRCFWILGYQMAICARCLGAYIGTAVVLYSFLNKFKMNFGFFIFIAILAFGEILLEYYKVIPSDNYLRLGAGIALGLFIGTSIIKILDWLEGKKGW